MPTSQLPAMPVNLGSLESRRIGITALAPFVLLTATFIFFGLTGHDPWKADEAYVFGIIHSMLKGNSWLVPLVAGEPFMEKPPLYYWAAAGLVRVLSGWISEPDAARLTSGIFMGITCWAVASAAHHKWGNGVGRYAPLMLLACLGILVQSHMMMPDVSLLTGFALAAWGFFLILDKFVSGGVLIGLGVGIGFLSKGLLGPAVIGMTSLLLPLCFIQWRSRTYSAGISIAFLVALPMLAIWPLLLYVRSPELFSTWFWDNNFGRYFGFAVVSHGTEHLPGFWWETLPWFTFPTLPLAAQVVWQRRRALITDAALQSMLLMFAVTLFVLSTSASVRAVYALPLLIPLAVLAAPSAHSIKVFPDLIWSRSCQVMFGVLACAIWLVWIIMMVTGAPPAWAWLLRYLPGDFTPKFSAITFSLAFILTIGAALASYRFDALPGRALTSWIIGLTLVWSLLSTLWMPWLDHAKSYRSVFSHIPWPVSTNCVASIGLGESERAMLDFFADRVTMRREISPNARCDTLLLQGYDSSGTSNINPRKWKRIWTGARPGDHWQRFWLFRARRSQP